MTLSTATGPQPADTLARLQLLTGDAELAAAVAAGVADHGAAFSLYVSIVATEAELDAPALRATFDRRYLGSFTDGPHAHRLLTTLLHQAATTAGHPPVSDEHALKQALSLLYIVETDRTFYVFTRPLARGP